MCPALTMRDSLQKPYSSVSLVLNVESALMTITGHNFLSAAALQRLSDVHEDISSTMRRSCCWLGMMEQRGVDMTVEKDEQS